MHSSYTHTAYGIWPIDQIKAWLTEEKKEAVEEIAKRAEISAAEQVAKEAEEARAALEAQAKAETRATIWKVAGIGLLSVAIILALRKK